MAKRSEGVHHGAVSWVDYDRSWFFRRQFLVTDYHASILGNFVAVALTIACPRLWILIKAFILFAWNKYETTYRKAKRTSAWGTNSLLDNNFDATQESHSELEAARDLVGNILVELRPRHIELPTGRIDPQRRRVSYLSKLGSPLLYVSRIWKNFAAHPVDILASLLLCAMFLGIFVAESTGSILSAAIVGNSTALASSTRCSIDTEYWHNIVSGSRARAAAYAKQCYNARIGADGCNFFYSQSIPYNERSNETCPFMSQTCAFGPSGAVSFDTGLLDAGVLGLNAAKRYQFRRNSTCVPLIPDGKHYGFISDADAYRCLWNSRMTDRKGLYTSSSPCPVSSSLDPLNYSPRSILSSYVSLIQIYSDGICYSEARDDPVFPASYRDGRNCSNSVLPALIGCTDQAEICDPETKHCWSVSLLITINDALDKVAAGAQICDFNTGHCWSVSSSPTLVRPRSAVSDTEAAIALLANALSASSVLSARSRGPDLELASHCTNLFCKNVPKEQWKVEARTWFETSLAQARVELLNTVQGVQGAYEDYHGIPPEYRAMCSMGKFRSTGWTNVSVWGFLGLLFLAAAISLASIKTEEDKLWLVVGAYLFNEALRWVFKKVVTALCKSFSSLKSGSYDK